MLIEPASKSTSNSSMKRISDTSVVKCWSSLFSALIKQVNKSIDGTADDEEEGVPTDQAIRAGLELLKVSFSLGVKYNYNNCFGVKMMMSSFCCMYSFITLRDR